jgi:hypothetical protein
MIAKSVIDTSLKYNGVLIVGIGQEPNKKFYYLTNTEDVINYINPTVKEDLISDETKFKTLDVKYGIYREIEYSNVSDLIMPCVPLFSSPRISEIDQKPSQDVMDRSKLFVDKFKALDKAVFTDISDTEISHIVNAFVKANSKNENLFDSSIDYIDSHIYMYDKGIAQHIYNQDKTLIDFFSTELGVMLEFFESDVKQKLKELLSVGNTKEALEFCKNCWRTLLEIYRNKSIEEYNEQIKKVNENSQMEDFEKEYALNSIQNEKDRIQKLDHEPYLELIDEPNSLIKYWPYNNVNLESTDSIVINLGGSSVDEKFGDNRPSKSIYVSNDYFYRLINIIKKYIPDHEITLKDCRGLFTESTIKNDDSYSLEMKQKIYSIKEALVNAKKAKLALVKEKMLEALKNEMNEVSEEEIKNEILEIINIIELSQREINTLTPQLNVVDILDFWPPALYPIPNELNPNK